MVDEINSSQDDGWRRTRIQFMETAPADADAAAERLAEIVDALDRVRSAAPRRPGSTVHTSSAAHANKQSLDDMPLSNVTWPEAVDDIELRANAVPSQMVGPVATLQAITSEYMHGRSAGGLAQAGAVQTPAGAAVEARRLVTRRRASRSFSSARPKSSRPSSWRSRRRCNG